MVQVMRRFPVIEDLVTILDGRVYRRNGMGSAENVECNNRLNVHRGLRCSILLSAFVLLLRKTTK